MPRPRRSSSLAAYLLSTNSAPSEDHAAHFASLIKSARSRIAELHKAAASNVRVEATESSSSSSSDESASTCSTDGSEEDNGLTLEEVSEYERLKTCIRNYTLILSPIRTLPHDILIEIFQHLVQSSSTMDGSLPLRMGGERAYRSIWAVGTVCRYWREAALSTKALWGDIHLRLGKRKTVGPELYRWQRMLDLQLTRAGYTMKSKEIQGVGVPLNVWVISDHDIPSMLLSILLPTSPYWRKLHLDLPSSQIFIQMGSYFAHRPRAIPPFASLVTLHIDPPYINSSALLDLFKASAPQLNEIITFPSSVLKDFDFPLNQITRFIVPAECHGTRVERVRGVLECLAKTADNLQEACLVAKKDSHASVLALLQKYRETELEDANVASSLTFTLPHLHTLRLKDARQTDASLQGGMQLLRYLTLPSLRQLGLYVKTVDVGVVKGLVERSGGVEELVVDLRKWKNWWKPLHSSTDGVSALQSLLSVFTHNHPTSLRTLVLRFGSSDQISYLIDEEDEDDEIEEELLRQSLGDKYDERDIHGVKNICGFIDSLQSSRTGQSPSVSLETLALVGSPAALQSLSTALGLELPATIFPDGPYPLKIETYTACVGWPWNG